MNNSKEDRMGHIRNIAVVVFCLALAPGVSWGKVETVPAKDTAVADSEKIKDIRKLVHVMSGKQMKDMVDSIMKSAMAAVMKEHPGVDVPDSVLKDLLTEADFEEIMEKMVPAYDRHFTHTEIKEILAFQQSPTGKKMQVEMPPMMQEIMPDLMGWMKTVGDRAKQKLELAMGDKDGKDGAQKVKKPASGEK
jgi:hypothetical protein